MVCRPGVYESRTQARWRLQQREDYIASPPRNVPLTFDVHIGHVTQIVDTALASENRAELKDKVRVQILSKVNAELHQVCHEQTGLACPRSLPTIAELHRQH